jgi:hypothetical protein
MKLLNYFKAKCLVTDDAAYTLDNLYAANITASVSLEEKLQAAKNYLGEKHILHPVHAVKRKENVQEFILGGK